MKRLITTIIILGLLTIAGLYAKRKFYNPAQRTVIANKQVAELADKGEIKNGDIIFQTSLSEQSKAIQFATHSEYSHCGIVYKNGNDFFVYEAVEPVKLTSLNKWIVRGQGGHFVIKRLKNADEVLTAPILKKMQEVGDRFKNKHYDIYFEWSDDKIYCSELIWKIYKEATGLEIGKLEKLKDFDLTSAPVKLKMKERYGDKIPLDETVISPVSIYSSNLLITVKSK
ncbi:MAG: YiiX family permuted papain-like enzyme [Ferruginibacter sp.]